MKLTAPCYETVTLRECYAFLLVNEGTVCFISFHVFVREEEGWSLLSFPCGIAPQTGWKKL